MSLAAFSVRNWQFTTIFLLFLMALGARAWVTVSRAEDPTFEAPSFLVLAVLPGASPEEVESLVVDPLEDRIRPMEGLDRLRATAQDGVAVLQVEYALEADAADRNAALLREVEAARSELPADLARLEVEQIRPSTVKVLQYALVAHTAPLADLRRAARDVEAALETVPGVRGADIDALPEERIDVAVDIHRLSALNLPVGAVFQALAQNDARIPGGHVEVGPRRFNVSADAAWASPEQIARTPIVNVEGTTVLVGDVATVTRRHAEPDHLARYDGSRAVWVTASLEDGTNVFDARDAMVAAAEAVDLPDGVSLVLGFDQSLNVEHRLSGFTRDFLIAIGLVLLTLLPLGLRASAVVMISIPLSLAVGLASLQLAGYGINQLSIVGFVIALGLLVDDAIVVVENVARHLRMGKSPLQAAIAGTDEISLAVLGCTATLLLAFLPLVFLPGTAGLFIRSLPMAVLLTVAASLLVSLTIVPLLASRWLRDEGEHGNRVLQLLTGLIERTYRPVLDRAIRRPKTTLVGAAALFAGSLALVPVVGFSLFPKAGIPQFRVLVDTGDGASLAATDAAVRFVEAELLTHPEVVAVMANAGEGNPSIYYNVSPSQTNAAVGEVFARLDRYDADATPALLDRLRATFDGYPGARITVKEFENGPPVDAPVAIRLVGDDLGALRDGAAALEALLRATPGLTAVYNPLARPRTDLAVVVDRDRAGLLGVPVADVARGVRFALAGIELGHLRDAAGEELPIVVRTAGAAEPTLERLAALHLATPGGTVPLAEVAHTRFETSPASIRHEDGDRTVTVSADVTTGTNVATMTTTVLEGLDGIALPAGVRWELAGEAESRAESFDGIGIAALVAAFGILAVLVLEFKTFRGTLVVLTVIPLGVTGGILALLFSGNTLSFTAAIGFVALVGIEVKNSILLVDFANQLRREGLSLDAAIQRAGEVRFVPILLTTATALGGLVPLALEGSALYSPLALVIIGGLLSSTFLARLVTPVAYKLLAPPLEEAPAPTALDAPPALA